MELETPGIYPDDAADALPVISGPWDYKADAEEIAVKYASAGYHVVIDYQRQLGSRKSGWILRDATERGNL